VLVHKQPHDVWRIDYQLQAGEDPELAVSPEQVLPRVASLLAMMGETAAWSPIWISLYKANALSLERYRHGRVFFMGDAAHLLPIFGVRGANSSIDDADNLAWKLAAVIKGQAADRLLDSYCSERVAAAKENRLHGTKSTAFMAPPNFADELMRTAVLSLAEQHPKVRALINPRQTTPITYAESALNSGEAPQHGPRLGEVLREMPLADGQYLTQCVQGFTLLCVDAPHLTEPVLGLPLPSLAPAYSAGYYLVRPDGHLCAYFLPNTAGLSQKLQTALQQAQGFPP
jgi:3-(3-hydroxy-phenyl)propionate hydroxylase